MSYVCGKLTTSGVQLGTKHYIVLICESAQKFKCESVLSKNTSISTFQSHTFLVSHSFGIKLSCSNTVTISHSVTHYSIPICVIVQKLLAILGIEVVLVMTSTSSHTFLLSNPLILTLSHSFLAQICFVWVVHKFLEKSTNLGKLSIP